MEFRKGFSLAQPRIQLSLPRNQGLELLVFPSSETGMSGNFGGRIKGAKYRFVLQDGTWATVNRNASLGVWSVVSESL